MTAQIISNATRTEFREVLSSFVLREINDIFGVSTLSAKTDYQPATTGQRRSLVEQYLINVDLSNGDQVKQLVLVFEELIFRLKNPPSWSGSADNSATIDKLIARMERDGFTYVNGRFESRKFATAILSVPLLIALTEESIAEHVHKARAKIEAGDPAGAITSVYTLIEGFLKEILKSSGISYKETEGDIRTLYANASGPLNLSPKGEGLESYLKAILQGLVGQITGLYELANKASDRHARKYNPARHHAELAINTAFTFCEFVLASHQYQQEVRKRRSEA